jgi:hypothetical protein
LTLLPYSRRKGNKVNYVPASMASRELSEAVRLCDPARPGRLDPDAVGWSRLPLHRCDLSGAWLRKKRWNYWAFTNETHLFSATVSNIDYAGLAFVYVADFERGSVLEATVVTPFGRGCALPETVHEDVVFRSRKLQIAMRQRVDPRRVEIRVDMPGFAGRGLHAELEASYPEGHETLNVVIPWDDRRFQFTAKHNTLPAHGCVRLGASGEHPAEEIAFAGAQSFACLDFGRGIWPRRCAWNWGAASGTQDGRSIGLNLGGKWTDGTGATENALCIAGRLTKIDEDLVWEYDRDAWLAPWRVRAPASGALDLRFTPGLERVAALNVGLVRSEVHQLFGRWSGSLRAAGGEAIEVRDLVGWAEEHRAIW